MASEVTATQQPDPGVGVDGAVTTVVMTRDRWPDLERSLPRHETPVILVDNGSSDGTPHRVRASFPDVRVEELDRNLGAVARNIGVRAAATRYVAFADDDSWWAPGALRRAAAVLDAHPRLAVLAGLVLVGTEERPDPVCTAMARSPLPRDPDLPGPPVLGFVACGAVVRRDAFLEVGGFDPLVSFPGEEEVLALRLAARGWALSHVESVVAHHRPSSVRPATGVRQIRQTRNELLSAMLHRPWPVVGQRVGRAWRYGRTGRRALLAALPAAPAALRQRRPLPAHVEASCRLLDGVG